jgi:hypothetical protein
MHYLQYSHIATSFLKCKLFFSYGRRSQLLQSSSRLSSDSYDTISNSGHMVGIMPERLDCGHLAESSQNLAISSRIWPDGRDSATLKTIF